MGAISESAFWEKHKDVVACSINLPKPVPSLQQISSIPILGVKTSSSKYDTVMSGNDMIYPQSNFTLVLL